MGDDMESINPSTFVAHLHETGQHAAAEGAAAMNEVEAAAAPVPFQRPGAAPDDGPVTHAAHAESAAANPAAGARTASAHAAAPPGEQEQSASAAEVGHEAGHDEPAGGSAATTGHDGAHDEAAAHAHDHVHGAALPGADIGADHSASRIDPADPLSGLYSPRLRDSLEREAFRTATSTAQDSVIAERVLSPTAQALFERAKSIGREPLPFDISPAAQDARIAALKGDIPPFARGNPELDPSLIRERNQSLAQSIEQVRTQAPVESAVAVSSPSHVAASSRARGIDMER